MPRSTICHGLSKSYYANMDSSGDEQRNVKMSEVDEFAHRSGKNLRGYLPSTLFPFLHFLFGIVQGYWLGAFVGLVLGLCWLGRDLARGDWLTVA